MEIYFLIWKNINIGCKFITYSKFLKAQTECVSCDLEINTRSVTGDSGMMEELPKKCWHIPDSILQFSVIPILGWQAKEVRRCMLALNNFLLVSDHWLTDKYNRLQELEVWLFVQAVWYEVRHHSGHLALPVKGSAAPSSSLQPWKGPISVCSTLALATLHSKRKPFLKGPPPCPP